jgi:hypothetical protein
VSCHAPAQISTGVWTNADSIAAARYAAIALASATAVRLANNKRLAALSNKSTVRLAKDKPQAAPSDKSKQAQIVSAVIACLTGFFVAVCLHWHYGDGVLQSVLGGTWLLRRRLSASQCQAYARGAAIAQ